MEREIKEFKVTSNDDGQFRFGGVIKIQSAVDINQAENAGLFCILIAKHLREIGINTTSGEVARLGGVNLFNIEEVDHEGNVSDPNTNLVTNFKPEPRLENPEVEPEEDTFHQWGYDPEHKRS